MKGVNKNKTSDENQSAASETGQLITMENAFITGGKEF